MHILLLRFDAPSMSFGGVMVDQHGPTERFPGLSLLTGLFANALGYRHGEATALEALQARIDYAARWDIEPQDLLDYHTVDLGQPKMADAGWTTRGEPEHRTGGAAAALGIHQRYRHYWANGVMTVAVGLAGLQGPTVAELADALRFPVRPLFLGRKTCLPAAPLFLGTTEAPEPLSALARTPLAERTGYSRPDRVAACWSGTGDTEHPSASNVSIYDRRDWHNQVHTGRRTRIQGWLEVVPR